MKSFTVVRFWTVSDTVTVKAETESEAECEAIAMPLGTDPEYVDGSIGVSFTEED